MVYLPPTILRLKSSAELVIGSQQCALRYGAIGIGIIIRQQEWP